MGTRVAVWDDTNTVAMASTGEFTSDASIRDYFSLGGASGPDEDANGLLYSWSKIRFRDITDGSSNTLLVGERDDNRGAAIWAGIRNQSHGSGFPLDPSGLGAEIDASGLIPETIADRPPFSLVEDALGCTLLQINSRDYGGVIRMDTASEELRLAFYPGFGSKHDSGAHFLFADGSVHYINDTIDSNASDTVAEFGTLQRLSVRNDGLVLPDF